MTSKKLTDSEGKALLRRWPERTRLWPPPCGSGYWIRAQPSDHAPPGPKLFSPGAKLFGTQPDGLWVYFGGSSFCDVVAVEVCGTIQNLNDKRSRYIPASHSVVLRCSLAWLTACIRLQHGGEHPRWRAVGTFDTVPVEDLSIPVRHLRVLYGLPSSLYHKWCREHTPTGSEFFCPHSSLATYNSQAMQKFLARMSSASHFRVSVNPS